MFTTLKLFFAAYLLGISVQEKPSAQPGLVINEIMATNSSIADPTGDFDDWIELFNGGSEPVNLSGYFLSDDNTIPSRWKFPDGTSIGPGEYLIVWADQDAQQPGLHASFKLSSDGEIVILSAPDKSTIDKIRFRAHKKELSFARIPDGSGEFKWTTPTPGKRNE